MPTTSSTPAVSPAPRLSQDAPLATVPNGIQNPLFMMQHLLTSNANAPVTPAGLANMSNYMMLTPEQQALMMQLQHASFVAAVTKASIPPRLATSLSQPASSQPISPKKRPHSAAFPQQSSVVMANGAGAATTLSTAPAAVAASSAATAASISAGPSAPAVAPLLHTILQQNSGVRDLATSASAPPASAPITQSTGAVDLSKSSAAKQENDDCEVKCMEVDPTPDSGLKRWKSSYDLGPQLLPPRDF